MKKLIFFFIIAGVLFSGAPAGAADKIRIAVVDFSAIDIAMEKGKEVSAAIREEMKKSNHLDIPSWEEVEGVFGETDSLYKMRMEQSDCMTLTCGTRVARALQAHKTIFGTVISKDGLIYLNATVIDLAKWDTDFVASEFCENEAGIQESAKKLAAKIARWFPKAGELPEVAKKRRLEDEKQDEIAFNKRIDAKLEKKRKREKGTCPEDMVLVKEGEYLSGSPADDPDRYKSEPVEKKVHMDEYCIDKYEYYNKKTKKPRKKNEWYGAKDICKKQGKRLCSDEEWEKACKGPENLRYPYGNEYDPQKCNTESGKISLVGAYNECVSGYGAYDMSGNLKEWMTSKSLGMHLNMRGGYYKSKARETRCSAFKKVIPFGSRVEYGFRCCK